jgi:hypothetical protein
MFTIEMNHDETAIVILDEDAEFEDIEIILYEDIVYICQWCEEIDDYIVLSMSPEMFEAINAAFNLPEGAYCLRNK